MTRVTFWAINLTGAYLILTRDQAETFSTRVVIGIALILAGTGGILFMHLWPRLRAKDEEESGGSKQS